MSDVMVLALTTLGAYATAVAVHPLVKVLFMKPRHEEFVIDPTTGKIFREIGYPNAAGYTIIRDRRPDGSRCDRYAHRMIWESVHGPIPDGLTINHKNGIKSDNRIDNLELATPGEQIVHAYATGLRSRDGRHGSDHPQAKLTEAQVRAMRGAYTGKRGEIAAFARDLGVTASHVARILRGRNWAHIQ